MPGSLTGTLTGMDLMAPLLATDPASPRITTYTDRGRMELSATTAANWAAKGGNLLTWELGFQPGDVVAVDCPTDWLPAALVLGCWRAGVAVCPVSSPAVRRASALIVTADGHRDAGDPAGFTGEVLLVSTDPFGRGVVESGGEVPPGLTDLAPELRIQADRYTGPAGGPDEVLLIRSDGTGVTGTELRELALTTVGDGVRAVTGPWSDTEGLVTALLPLFVDGSVVLSDDGTPDRLSHLAEVEHGVIPAR